jgi:hypothetical protein
MYRGSILCYLPLIVLSLATLYSRGSEVHTLGLELTDKLNILILI